MLVYRRTIHSRHSGMPKASFCSRRSAAEAREARISARSLGGAPTGARRPRQDMDPVQGLEWRGA